MVCFECFVKSSNAIFIGLCNNVVWKEQPFKTTPLHASTNVILSLFSLKILKKDEGKMNSVTNWGYNATLLMIPRVTLMQRLMHIRTYLQNLFQHL